MDKIRFTVKFKMTDADPAQAINLYNEEQMEEFSRFLDTVNAEWVNYVAWGITVCEKCHEKGYQIKELHEANGCPSHDGRELSADERLRPAQ